MPRFSEAQAPSWAKDKTGTLTQNVMELKRCWAIRRKAGHVLANPKNRFLALFRGDLFEDESNSCFCICFSDVFLEYVAHLRCRLPGEHSNKG